MSSLIPSGGASGTGSVTLLAPNTNSTQTQTLPDATGTVMVSGNMPAFAAYANTPQTFSSNTVTKINFGSEEYDTNSNFSSSRFTPTVAGYYQVNAMLNFIDTSASLSDSAIYFYKNGARYLDGSYYLGRTKIVESALIYCNGTTDYIEVYGLAIGGGTCGVYGSTTLWNGQSWFNGSMVRGA